MASNEDNWKKVIDDAVNLWDRFTIADDLTVILNKANPDIEPAEDFVSAVMELNARFRQTVTAANVNTYMKYNSSFENDKYPLWRKDKVTGEEAFTPALYLAKASPICAESFLIHLLSLGADLSLRAHTKGCWTSYCTTIGKISCKFYPVDIKNTVTGQSKTVRIPKFLTMFNCLQELNTGNFLVNRVYIYEMPDGQLKNTIIANVHRWTVTGNMSGRLFRCPYTRRRGPNTRNSWPRGCGIPGISGFSSFVRSTGGGRTGKVLLGVGALAGLVALTVTTGGAGALFGASIAAASSSGMGAGLAKVMLLGLSTAFAATGVAGATFIAGQTKKALGGQPTIEAQTDIQDVLQSNPNFMEQVRGIPPAPVESGGKRRLRKSRTRKNNMR